LTDIENDQFANPLVSININILYLETLDDIINYKFMRSINICKIHKTTSIEKNYNIINYPHFFFFLLDID